MNQCPWSGFAPAVLTFCEHDLCSWIKEPANAYSSLIYVGIGFWVWLKERPSAYRTFRFIAIMAAMVGITSFLYHASMLYVTEVFDLGSMYLLSVLLLCVNMMRLRIIRPRYFLPLFVGLMVLSLATLLITRDFGVYIFAAQLVLFGIMEVRLLMTERPLAKYKNWLLGVGSLLVAYGIWLLDFHRIVCMPDNHVLQGHAAWHIINSFGFLFAYRFCAQFNFTDAKVKRVRVLI